jgi:hypothetical protein
MLIRLQEVYAYLSAVERTWKYILGTDIRPDQLDESTVVALQMQIPDSSTDDCDAIRKLFSNNEVFPFVEDQPRRRKLSERVLNCKRILSFQSFFDDFKYIRPCFENLSILIPQGSRRGDKSFQQVFRHNWGGNTQQANGKHDFLSCYIELWLFAMREFQFLSSAKASLPLQDKGSANKRIRPRMMVSEKEAQLAYKASLLGFDTGEIDSIKRTNPTEVQQYGPSRLPPEYSCDNCPLPQTSRSNRPSMTSYEQDRDYLHSIYMIHANPARKKRYATRIAVTKDIVQCCWTDTERWSILQRWSQQGRLPINVGGIIYTDKVPRGARHWSSGSGIAKPSIRKPPQRGLNSSNRTLYCNSYQKLVVSPGDGPVSTRIEFSEAFTKAQDMKEKSNTLQTTKHEGTKPYHESDVTNSVDPISKALQSLETPSLGTGETIGASLSAQNPMDGQKLYDHPMELDSPERDHASQHYHDDIEVVDDPSLQVEPLNVAIRQGLDGKDDKSGDRTFLSPLPGDTTRASSIYSSYDMTDGNYQDITHQGLGESAVLHNDASLVKSWADDGASNAQTSYQHLHRSQLDIDELGERVLPQHAERIPQNAVQTSSQGEASASHSKSVEDSNLATATKFSSRPIKATSSSHYSVQEGGEAELQIAGEAGLHENASSDEDPIYDGPAGGRGSYQTLEPHGDSSSPEETKVSSERATIPDDDDPHKMPNGHDATSRNADRYHSDDGAVAIESNGESGTNARPTKGRISQLGGQSDRIISQGEVEPSPQENRRRGTQIPLIEDGTMPLDFNGKDVVLRVAHGARRDATVLERKRKWIGKELKSKGPRIHGGMQPANVSSQNGRMDESI